MKDNAGVLIVIATFVVMAFLAGGALTLVDLAHTMRDAVDMLRQIQETELRRIADDVHHIAGIALGKASEDSVRAALASAVSGEPQDLTARPDEG